MKKKAKILICGMGSIGQRHALNLVRLGYKNLIFFRHKKKYKTIRKLKEYKIFYDIKKALLEKPEATLICNVTSKHIDLAIKCAKKGSHIFIEKPLSNKLERLLYLKNLIKKKKLTFMVGYMMKFHPLIIKIKEILRKNSLGNIYYSYSTWSEFLPDWHPYENYKRSYASNKRLGGGSTLTLSHEIDLLIWFFGKIKKISTLKNMRSKLNINAEFATDHQIEFNGNKTAHVHVDYMQKPYNRRLEIYGDKKKLIFNYYQNKITIVNRNGRKKIIQLKKFNRNKLFINELKYFSQSVGKNLRNTFGIDNNIYLLKNLIK